MGHRLLRRRFATSQHLHDEFWGAASMQASRRRFKLLTDAGYLLRLEVPLRRGEGTHPAVYTVTRKFLDLLTDALGEDATAYPLPDEMLKKYDIVEKGLTNFPFIAHTLATIDLELALVRACRPLGITIVDQLYEHECRSLLFPGRVALPLPEQPDGAEEVQTEPYTLVPDLYMHLKDGEVNRSQFLLECDRSTVVINATRWETRSWVKKILAYKTFFESEACQEHFVVPPRVLTVTKTPARLDSLLTATIEALEGGDDHFWYTTMEEALAQKDGIPQILTGRIWQIADEDANNADTGEIKRYSLLEY